MRLPSASLVRAEPSPPLTAVAWQRRFFFDHPHPLDPTAGHGQDAHHQPVYAHFLAGGGHLTQMAEDEAAHAIEVPLLHLHPEQLLQCVDADAGVEDRLAVADAVDALFVAIELVGDLADDLLQ